MTIRRVLLLLILFLPSTSGASKLFVPKLEPWDTWVAADESNTATIAHTDWQELLDSYLLTGTADGINLFDYRQVSDADRKRLQAYLARLADIDPREYARAEQLAYWINLYNALTVEVVLEHYPVRSIRKIYGGLLGTGPWNEPLIEVAGQPLTLNDIEHRILRPIWRDPRIHFVVNCASLGCPDLAAEAYTAANTEALMTAGAQAFINHPRGASFREGRLYMSSIFDWYDSDFGATQEERLDYLAGFARAELADRLRGYDGRIRYDYDWNLNAP